MSRPGPRDFWSLAVEREQRSCGAAFVQGCGVPLILFHTRKVRNALVAPAAFGTELFFVLLVSALIAGIIMISKQVSAPYTAITQIDLSYWALPKYTVLSLCRGFVAYGLSLAFTLVYGTIAAHSVRAEKLMLPALDVLQAIPVLGFLPGLVLAMIALFPAHEIGLELACIVMIFTGQAWNMTFSFHGSLRGIPQTMREAARVNGLSGWQVFKMLEVPASMIGLVWNSMMSMAGGWFFLMTIEAFTLRDRDFRLPGLGSYMNEAINRPGLSVADRTGPIVAAIVAMVLMIVMVDQLFWRPIVVWSQKYKMEETTEADKPQSWVLQLLAKSRIYHWLLVRASGRGPKFAATVVRIGRRVPAPMALSGRRSLPGTVLRWAFLGALAIGVILGTWSLVRLLVALPVTGAADGYDWVHVILALLASFVRTSAAVLLGAAWALPAGIVIGRSPKWSQRLQPVIQVVASFPAPMLFPLVTIALVWLHIPFTVGCVALMLLGAQWYILFNVIAGASAIPADLKEAAIVNHLSRRQLWMTLYLPCVFPYLLTGLITAAGGAWNATIVSEYVNFSSQTYSAFGLGAMISKATADGNYPLLCASVVAMAVFVVLVNRFFWKRLYRFAEERCSLNV